MVTKMATNSFKFFPVPSSQDALCLKSVYRNTLVPFEQISHFHTKWSAYNGDVWTPSGCLRSSFQYLHSHSQFLRFRESNQMKSIEQGAMRGFDRPKAWSSTSKRGTASILRNLKSTLIRCEWTCDLVWGDQTPDQWPVRGAVCSVYDNLALTMVVMMMVIALMVKDQMKPESVKVFTGSFHSTGSVFHVIHGLTIKKILFLCVCRCWFWPEEAHIRQFFGTTEKNEDLALAKRWQKNPETVIHSAL